MSKFTYDNYRNKAIVAASRDSFPTKQAQRDALDNVSRAYEKLIDELRRDILMREVCQERKYDLLSVEESDGNMTIWDVPFNLYQVREKHYPIIKNIFGADPQEVKDLVELRSAIKAIPVVKPEPRAKAPAGPNSATHSGTCQICGRAHKVSLSDGTLAKHGYNVYGQFMNECSGSDRLPYEKDNRLILEHMIALTALIVEMSDDEEQADNHHEKRMIRAKIDRANLMVERLSRRADNWKERDLTPIE